jgi:hypothetical protein
MNRKLILTSMFAALMSLTCGSIAVGAIVCGIPTSADCGLYNPNWCLFDSQCAQPTAKDAICTALLTSKDGCEVVSGHINCEPITCQALTCQANWAGTPVSVVAQVHIEYPRRCDEPVGDPGFGSGISH